MGVLYSVGNALVEPLELAERAAAGPLIDFAAAARAGIEREIELSTGRVSTSELAPAGDDPLGFEPIGLGRPLAAELLAVYTGDAPERGFLGRVIGRKRPGMLVVSAARTPGDFGRAPRAINQVVEEIGKRRTYRPSALRDGSPIIYYSPAVVDATTFLSVELVADTFDGSAPAQISALLGSAAGLPLFAPAATWLLAGSAAARIGAQLGDALAETGPFLHASEDLRFDSAGFPVDLARFLIFADERHLDELQAYAVRVEGVAGGGARVILRHRGSGEAYAGDAPHVIASLDGRARPEYDNFRATHASATMVEHFYGSEALPAATEALTEAMTLWNDLAFRRRAEALHAEIETLPEGSSEREEAEARRAALLANIRSEAMRAGLSGR